MRFIIIYVSAIILVRFPTMALHESYIVKELTTYTMEAGFNTLLLRMDFGKSEIKNPELYKKTANSNMIEEVDVVFTLYPFQISDWEKKYEILLRNRLASLAKIAPQVMNDRKIKINIVLQTKGNTEESARKLFHGIALKYKPSGNIFFNEYIFRKSMEGQNSENIPYEILHNEVSTMVYGLKAIVDSTVVKVVERNLWKNMIVVTDWTGSMYPYGAQLISWHRLHFDSNKINGYVFFNDGNKKKDKQKVIGRTGGVVYCHPPTIDSLLSVMGIVMRMGRGGDIPENNIEAMLKAISKSTPDSEIIMIADNFAGVRDMSLLEKVKKPIRIILCGVACGRPIHPHYLEIAKHTKGSIHTMEQDIHNVFALKCGSKYEINGVKYKTKKGKLFKI